ncbi:MAG TPA: site-2 protease family protein [Planctomycetota bacterium]
MPPPDLLAFAVLAFMELPPIGIALVLALLVLSLGIHEAAHGWVALQRGDTTARDLGRITLNPVPHIDPFMTILLPLMMLFSSGGNLLFGGAKPVPVNYFNLRHPLRDMALVAIAGPLSNFLLAAFFFLCWKVVVVELGVWNDQMIGAKVLQGAIHFNLLLAAFNLLPIPPLDGSRVMTWLLPGGLREAYSALERWGLYLVVLFVFLVPGVRELVIGTMRAMLRFIEFGVTLGGAW